MTTNNTPKPGLRPRGARLTSKTVRTPANPVPTRPPTASGGDEEKRDARARAESKPKGSCFVDDDHSEFSQQELELFPTEVQLPGSSIKAKVQVCLHHKMEMDQLKEHGLAAAKSMSIAPYGRCYNCDEPVGLRDEETRLPDSAGELVPVTYWVRADLEEHVVHERCRPAYRLKVEDEHGNESKPGWVRRIVLV